MIVACGIHLMPVMDAIGTPRPSCLAGLDAGGALVELTCVDTDDQLLAGVPATARVIAVDAPLVVANASGQRPVEQLLSWLDVPVFPNSISRLTQIYGGLRGVGLRARLAAGGAAVVEALPELVLREVAWEAGHPATEPQLPLAEYREAWLGVRAPRYRPKGRGRARPAGRAPAAALLAGVIDLGAWLPIADPDDWQAIADAARLDALACAYTGWRLVADPDHTLLLGDRTAPLAVPADANLRARADLHLARLARGG
jgi:predicted nuclease with RNAse H fold